MSRALKIIFIAAWACWKPPSEHRRAGRGWLGLRGGVEGTPENGISLRSL